MRLVPQCRLPRAIGVCAALLMLLLLLPAASAQAGRMIGKPAASARSKPAPTYYVLARPRERCRAHYVKERVTIRRRRHHRRVRVKQVRCVLEKRAGDRASAAGRRGSTPSVPANLPIGTVALTIVPSASEHAWSTGAGSTLSIGGDGVLAGATGSGLTAQLVSGPRHGSLTLDRDGAFRYVPASGASGVEQFTYRASSSDGESSTPATVTLDVTPVAVGGAYTVLGGGTLTIPAGGLLAGDLGTGLSAALLGGAADGSVTVNANGSATYTPASRFSGRDSFTYRAVDADGLASNAATVTIQVEPVADPPSVVPVTFSGAVGNTELVVGGAPGGDPEVYDGGTSALAGDSDPGGGTLSVTPGTIATAEGGTVTMAADGDFAYQPPAGFAGPSDRFAYTVDDSEGGSATATATIDFAAGAGRVWYVDSAASASGNGTSAAPFDSLAQVAQASSGDVIYLFGGGAPNYGGGIALPAAVSLVGSGTALSVAGQTLRSASGPAPVITNDGGAGIQLAEGDSVAGLDVEGTAGDGIDASGADDFTIASSVEIEDAGGDGLDIDGGDGTVAVGAQISGSAGHSVAIEGRTGASSVSVTGAIDDTGEGILLQDDSGTIGLTGAISAETGAQPAFVADDAGTVSATSASNTLTTTTGDALEVSGTTIGADGLDFASISASGAANGVLVEGDGAAGQGALTIDGGTIADTTGDAISISGSGTVQLSSLTLQDDVGDGIDADNVPTLDVTGVTVTDGGAAGIVERGDGSLGSQSVDIESSHLDGTAGDGLDLLDSDASFGATVNASTIENVASGDALDANVDGDATLAIDQTTLEIDDGDSALAVTSGAGSLCLSPQGDTLTAVSGAAVDLDQAGSGSFGVYGYDSSDLDTNLQGLGNTITGAVESSGTVTACGVGLA